MPKTDPTAVVDTTPVSRQSLLASQPATPVVDTNPVSRANLLGTSPTPATSPQAKPEEPGFWSTLAEGVKNWWNDPTPEPDKNQDVPGVYNKDKEKTFVDARKDIESSTIDKPSTGSGYDPAKVAENAVGFMKDASFFSDATNSFFSAVGLSTKNPDVTADKELSQLGYQQVTDADGKQTWKVTKPTLSPTEITDKLTNLRQIYEAKLLALEKHRNELTLQKSNLGTGQEGGGPSAPPPPPGTYETNPQNIDSEVEQTTKEINDLHNKYGEIRSLYGSAANSQSLLGSDDRVKAPYDNLQNASKDVPLDYKVNAASVRAATAHLKEIQSNPKLMDEMLQQGINSTYVDDSYAQFNSKQHLKDPRSGDNLPQAMVDNWQLNGLVPNIKSLENLIGTDDQIINQLQGIITKTQQEGKIKKVPIADIDETINKSGISDLLTAWRDYKEAKQSLASTLNQPLKTGLKDLVAFKSNEKYYDFLWRNQPKTTAVATAIQNFGNTISDAVTGKVFRTNEQSKREDLFRDDYIQPSYDQIVVPGKGPTVVYDDDGLKTVYAEPPVTQRVPFYAGRESHLWDSKPVNWDVALYNTIKGSLDIAPLIAAAIATDGISTALIGNSVTSLELGAAIEGAYDLGYGWRAATAAAKTAQFVVPRAIGVVLPSMLMFGPESIKREMENKGLSEDQAIKLGLLRSAIEGAVFSVSPTEMGKLGYRALIGEVENVAEDAAYKNLIEAGLNVKFDNRLYNALFDVGALGKAAMKSYAKSAIDLSTQLNTALYGNAVLTKYAQATMNKDYFSPEYELTKENILSTTMGALTTAVPFSLLHLKSTFDQTRFSRESAIYKVSQTPEYYLHKVDTEFKAGRIDEAEALRQKGLIDQARNVYTSITPDFENINNSDVLTDVEKHEKRFELFRNKLKQEAFKEEILKDIPDEEKVKHIEQLDETAKKYQEILDFQKRFDALSGEEKEQVRANQEFDKYRNQFLNEGLLKRYTVEDSEQRRDDLRELAKNEKNPYLAVRYENAANAIDLLVTDTKFKESQNPDLLQDKVSEFTDWFEEQAKRGNEQFDYQFRPFVGEGDEVSRGEFVKEFVEGQMDNQQKFIYSKYADLIVAEQNKRAGITPEPEPTDSTPLTETEQEKPTEEKDVTPPTEPIEVNEALAKRINGEPLSDKEWIDAKESESVHKELAKTTISDAASYFLANRVGDQNKVIGNSIPSEILDRIEKAVYDKTGEIIDATKLTPNEIKAKFGIDLYDPNTGISPDEEAPIVPQQELHNKTVEQTLEYRALNETNNIVVADNNTSAIRVFKLPYMDLNQEGTIVYSGRKLFRASNVVAYVGRNATFDVETGEWTADDNNLNPDYAPLHSAKFYQADTPITFKLVDEPDSLFVAENKKKYNENRELVDLYGFISAEDYDKNGKNHDNFAIVQILDDKGNSLGYLHDLSYVRSDRVIDYVISPSGEAQFNLGGAYMDMVKSRADMVGALRANGGTLSGTIGSTTTGSRAIRSDNSFVPITQAFTDPTTLKNITIVTHPDRYRINNQALANWKEIVPGSAIAPVKAPNGKYIGIVLRRNTLGKEWSSGVANALNFYTDYKDAIVANDTQKLIKLNKIAEDMIEKMGGDYNFDIRTGSGVNRYMNNIVFASEKSSKYISPDQNRTDLAKVPFIDFDSRENTLTWSSQRLLDETYEGESLNTFDKLNKVGVYRQLLFDSQGRKNPKASKFFGVFAKWLESRPLNFKTENFAITDSFEIPLLSLSGDEYSFMSPATAVNKGKSFQDFLTQNLTTDNLEFKITNRDGSEEHVYFEQPTKSFVPSVPKQEERLEAEDFWDKFKVLKTYAEAKKMADEYKDKFPGIQRSIDKRLKDLEPTKTYEDKKIEFDATWKQHNELAKELTAYNGIKTKTQRAKETSTYLRINNLAANLGYKVEANGRTGKLLVTNNGSKISARNFPEKPLEVKEGKINFAGVEVGKEDTLGFKFEFDNVGTDVYQFHPDFGMSKAQMKSGYKQIEEGKLESPTAQQILKRIAEWKASGVVRLIAGTGIGVATNGMPFSEYEDYAKQLSELPKAEDLSEEEFNTQVGHFDEFWNTLTPDQQEEYLDIYDTERVNAEPESELHVTEESIGPIPTEGEIQTGESGVLET